MDLQSLILLFSVALVATVLGMPLNIRMALRYGIVDKPDSRKTHIRLTPRIGGLAFVLSALVAIVLFIPIDRILLGFLAGTLLTLMVGAADDIWQISPRMKMAGQIVAATLFVLISGVSIRYFGDLFGIGNLDTGPFALLFTVFSIVAVMNAINLSDGLDGLAGGISLIALAFLLYFALLAEHSEVAYMAIAFAGSIVGFLYFNVSPAKTFMGDAGSITLGFVLSALSVLLVFDGRAVPGSIQPITLALLICLPIMDTVSVMIRRLVKGQKLSDPDNRHLHHVLLSLDFSKRSAVLIIYLMMIGFGVLAMALQGSAEWLQLLSGALLTGLLLFGCFYLQKKNFSVGKSRRASSDYSDADPETEEGNPVQSLK